MCERVVGERHVTGKARVIATEPSHTLAKHYQLLPSGRRFRMPKVTTPTAARSSVSEPGALSRDSCFMALATSAGLGTGLRSSLIGNCGVSSLASSEVNDCLLLAKSVEDALCSVLC